MHILTYRSIRSIGSIIMVARNMHVIFHPEYALYTSSFLKPSQDQLFTKQSSLYLPISDNKLWKVSLKTFPRIWFWSYGTSGALHIVIQAGAYPDRGIGWDYQQTRERVTPLFGVLTCMCKPTSPKKHTCVDCLSNYLFVCLRYCIWLNKQHPQHPASRATTARLGVLHVPSH